MYTPSPQFIRETESLRTAMYREGRLTDLRDLLERTHRFFGERDCIAEIVGGQCVAYSVRTFYDDVRALGTWLLRSGSARRHIAVLGENSYLWLVVFFAVSCTGGVIVPLDKELPGRDIALLADKADCAALFCSPTYRKNAEDIQRQHPGFPVLLLTDTPDDDTVRRCIDEGRQMLRDGADDYASCAVDGDTVAAILFTSGTTGANKGVRLTHRNLTTNVDGVIRTNDPVYSVMSVLPMHHIYELGSTVLPHIYCNALIYINDRLRNFFANVRAFHPEYIAVVPLFAENIRRTILYEAQQEGRLDQLQRNLEKCRQQLSAGIDRRQSLFAQERKPFGEKFPYLACGGAKLHPETALFLDTLGFRLLMGYGLTETSPIVTLNINAGKHPDSVGIPFPFNKIRILDPAEDGVGEICVKGENVTPGYYKDPDADAVSFENGWFKTGDYGRFGKHGELYITGRKKNLILLPNGKNVYPEELEYFFTSDLDVIREAVVFDAVPRDRDKAAILVLAVTLQPSHPDSADLSAVRQAILARNKQLPSYKRVRDVVICQEPFEKTSTQKIIRKTIKERYEHDARSFGNF